METGYKTLPHFRRGLLPDLRLFNLLHSVDHHLEMEGAETTFENAPTETPDNDPEFPSLAVSIVGHYVLP